MVSKTGFFPGDPDNPFDKNKDYNIPKDRSNQRKPFRFGRPPQSKKPSAGSGRLADWSEKELWDYLGFLNNPPKPEDLEERPEGGYRP